MKISYLIFIPLIFITLSVWGEPDPAVQALIDGFTGRDSSPPISKAVTGCANFTGEWEGSCISDGAALPGKRRLSIVQHGCEVISTGAEQYLIGGSSDRNSHGPRGTLSVRSAHVLHQSSQPFWDKKLQILNIMTSAEGHSLDAFKPAHSFVNATANWVLSDPKTLKTSFKLSGVVIDNHQTLPPVANTLECTYKKNN